jgi:hypothetical protein
LLNVDSKNGRFEICYYILLCISCFYVLLVMPLRFVYYWNHTAMQHERLFRIVPIILQPTCQVCNMQFKQAWLLRRHMRTVHMKIRHQCFVCQETYSRKDHLREHVQKKHSELNFFGEDAPNWNSSKYCPVCVKQVQRIQLVLNMCIEQEQIYLI